MLEINKIRENKKEFITLLKIKNRDFSDLLNNVIAIDDDRKSTQKKLDEILSQANQIAKKIGSLYKNGEVKAADDLKQESLVLKEQSKLLQTNKNQLEQDIQDILIQIPNTPHHSVPQGSSDDDNIVIREKGKIPILNSGAKPH